MGLFQFNRPDELDNFVTLNSVRDALAALTKEIAEVKETVMAIRRQNISISATTEFLAEGFQDGSENNEMLTDIYEALTDPDDKTSQVTVFSSGEPSATPPAPVRRKRRWKKIPLDPNETRPLITAYEVAERIGVNVGSVYRNIERGRLPRPYKKAGSKHSYWIEEEINEWLSAKREISPFTGKLKTGKNAIPKIERPIRATCQNAGCDNLVALKGRSKDNNPIYRKICSTCHKHGGVIDDVVGDEVGKPRFVLLPESKAKTKPQEESKPDQDAQPKKKVGRPVAAEKKILENKDSMVFENYRTALSLSYSDLESGFFIVIASPWIKSENNHKKFRSEQYRLLAAQSLDLFRDGKTLGQIRMMQPKVGGERPYLSIEGMLSRVVKAIFKLGTPAEIAMLKEGGKK